MAGDAAMSEVVRRTVTAGPAVRLIVSVLAVTATVSVLPIRPAAAVAAPVSGYVWANQPSVTDYTVSHIWAYNSTGGDITIHRSSAGVYHVRFRGMAVPGGIAHARPYGPGNTAICTVAGWRSRTGDEVVNVRCFDAAGVPADTRFVANFTNHTAAPATFAYLWANRESPTLDVPYAPTATHSYDSTPAGIQVWRQSVGVYMMLIGTVSAHYPVDDNDGVYQITAFGEEPVRCEVHGENDETPPPIGVFCFDENGAPTDSMFAVTYAHSTSLLGIGVPAANAYFRVPAINPANVSMEGYWNGGGAPSFTRFAVGVYRVSFPGIALTGGFATATARGSGPWKYCNVSYWSPDAVNVNCFDSSTDLPADSIFAVAMTD
jgi:hypothetical protein